MDKKAIVMCIRLMAIVMLSLSFFLADRDVHNLQASLKEARASCH